MFKKAQQSVAHQSTLPSGLNVLGNRDLKGLQEIIQSEKDYIKSSTKSSQDFHKTAEAIKGWSSTEGEDLHDILGKLSLLFDSVSTAQSRFNSHLSNIRQHFKSVRTREETLAELRGRKRSLGSKIEGVEKKLAKMGPENKELMKTTGQLKELRVEMESLRIEVQAEEAAIGDYKRRTVREAMGIKCGGLLEMAEKLTIIAEVGKMIIEEIPLEPTHPGMPRADYLGAMRTDQLLQEATRSLADVGFSPTAGGAGAHRQDYSGLRQSEMGGDSTQDYYINNTLGNGEANEEDVSRAGWEEDPQTEEQHDGGYQDQQASYNDPYTEETINAPIYAAHTQAAPVGHAPAVPVVSQDTATDEWRKSRFAQQPANRDSFPKPSSSTPIADQFASRSPEEYQVGPVGGLRVVDAESRESLDGGGVADGQRGGGHAAPLPSNPLPPPALLSTTPPPRGASSGLQHDGGGPPSQYSTPIPYHAQQQGTPYGAVENDGDQSYFQSVGSTRAAQQSVRRPMSPSNQGGSNNASLTGHAPPASPSTYEPQQEGRKMTAAAFRKGFGRAPSAQHVSTSNSNSGLGGAVSGHAGAAEGSDHTAPLAIRKRFSAVPGQTSDGQTAYDDHPAPPYQQQHHQSIYGGIEDVETGNEYALPQPPHAPWGSRPNSRPGSANGWRHPAA